MTGSSRRHGLVLLGGALLAALGVPAGPAAAQNRAIWRCGPDGRQFSDRPCPGGEAVPGPAPVPAAATQDALAISRREQALAERLALERQQRNQVAPGSGLMGIGSDNAARQQDRADRSRRKPVRPQRPSSRQQQGLPAPDRLGQDRPPPSARAPAPPTPKPPKQRPPTAPPRSKSPP